MKGCYYEDGSIVPGSFQFSSTFENLTIGAAAATSAAIAETGVVLSLTVGAHVAIGAPATTSSMVLPAGIHIVNIPKGSTVSVIQLAGGAAGICSVITPA